MFRRCSGLWRLWRRQSKSVTSCSKNRRTALPLPCTVNTVLKLFVFSTPLLPSVSFFYASLCIHEFHFLLLCIECSWYFILFFIFLSQASWRLTTCLTRTVKAYRRCLTKTAMPMSSGLRPGPLKMLPFPLWIADAHLEQGLFIARPASSPHACFLCFLLCSGCWWTQSRTSLSPWKRWLWQSVMNGCGSETMWRKKVTFFFQWLAIYCFFRQFV